MNSAKKKAFTLVEIIISVSIFAAIMAGIYNFFIRGLAHNELETKNLSAIQEMVFIVYNLRNDVRTMVEFENDPSTLAGFNAASKTLNFTLVNGVSDNGVLLYSGVKYYFRAGRLMKDYWDFSQTAPGQTVSRALSQPNKIKEFTVELLDVDGNPVCVPRKPGKPPLFMKLKIVHVTNARLDLTVNICSTYMNRQFDPMEKYWQPCWKIKPVTPVSTITCNTEKIVLSVGSNSTLNVTGSGVKVDQTMTRPDGLVDDNKVVIKR